MTDPADVETAVADAHRREWALVFAAMARVARDLNLAEECVQEAYASALTAWARDGIPDNPTAWLTTTAKRRAVDGIRRERVFRSNPPLLVGPEELVDEATMDEPVADEPTDVVPDERLRLIFMCYIARAFLNPRQLRTWAPRRPNRHGVRACALVASPWPPWPPAVRAVPAGLGAVAIAGRHAGRHRSGHGTSARLARVTFQASSPADGRGRRSRASPSTSRFAVRAAGNPATWLRATNSARVTTSRGPATPVGRTGPSRRKSPNA